MKHRKFKCLPAILNTKAFTSKEFLMVIVIIGVLCAASIPAYYSLRAASERQKASIWSTKITTFLKNAPSQTTQLDTNKDLSLCVKCFESVSLPGLLDTRWFKVNTSTYLIGTESSGQNLESFEKAGNLKLDIDFAAKSANISLID